MKKYLRRMLNERQVIKIKEKLLFREKPIYEKLLLRNEQFRNIHTGERCFVIGNGPSIQNLDFSLFKNEFTFTVNQLPRNQGFKDIETNYHAWVDARFFDIDESNSEDVELLEIMKGVNTLNNKPKVFYKLEAYEMIKRYKLDDLLDIYYLGDASVKNVSEVLKNDILPTHLMPMFSTVVQYLICLATYMGFTEIILLGCDCTGIINVAQSKLNNGQDAEYGYKITENEKRRLEKFNRVNSFEDELRYQFEMMSVYGDLVEYCRKRGVKLVNATQPSLLESVPKVKIEDLLK